MPPPANLQNPPKGTRTPGSGRKKGTPNRITVEAKVLVAQLVNDPAYQHRLRHDFRLRRIHPTVETLVWQYHLGRPTQPIAMSGSLGLDVNARLEEERRVFASLDLADLEQLAAESQALVDRAFQLSRMSQAALAAPLDVVVAAVADADDAETLGNMGGSDKVDYVNPVAEDDGTP